MLENTHQITKQDMITLRGGDEVNMSCLAGEITRQNEPLQQSSVEDDTDHPPISWSSVVCCGQKPRGTKPWCRGATDHPGQRQQ